MAWIWLAASAPHALTLATSHLEVDHEHNANLFFWHFENRHIANRQRTVIWLNGGPGCSSMDGALMEIGPYRVRDGGKLVYNEGSWDEFAHLLFIDNPVGTGFSYVDTDSYVQELNDVSRHLVNFLEKWFLIFPQYLDDDVCLPGTITSNSSRALIGSDIHWRRVVRRPVHSIYCQRDLRPEQEDGCE